MPKVIFLPNKLCPEERSVEVPAGTSILEASFQAGVPVGHACGGVCACSTCHVYIVKGEENLTEAEDKEEDRLDMAFQLRPNSRLGCQAEIEQGEVVVEVTPESIQAYLDENPKLRREIEERERAEREAR